MSVELRFTALNYYHWIKPMKILSSGSVTITKEIIVFDNKLFLSETLAKLIRDDYELKNSQRLH